jgi:hypothetical protein
MSAAFIVGYDPGGAGAHGIAALEVRAEGTHWSPVGLKLRLVRSLHDALAWQQDACRGRIVAAGIDTLTEWNSGDGGWRPADLWLRAKYPAVAKSVVSPNSIYGSMAVNGAAFLTLLAPRFRSDGTMVTEAHPKVCFFAMTGKKHAWVDDKSGMVAWLTRELGVGESAGFDDKDHCFDAGIALLAALRGANREWPIDLHALPREVDDDRVQFFGQTHYWWPST